METLKPAFIAALCAALAVPAARQAALAVDAGESEARSFAAAGGPDLTADDQGENEKDLSLTREIRRALVSDTSLSTGAKNVKIISVDGKVALKGRVPSDYEKDRIEAAAVGIAGKGNVDSGLEVGKR